VIGSRRTFTTSKTGDVTPEPPVWTPADIAAVKSWWRADMATMVSGGAVGVWTDTLSYIPMTQTTATNQPAFIASDPAFNGLPTISFDGSNDFLRTQPNGTLGDLGETFTIWMGVDLSNLSGGDGNSRILGINNPTGADGNNNTYFRKDGASENGEFRAQVMPGASNTPTTNIENVNSIIFSILPATVNIYLDGVLTYTSARTAQFYDPNYFEIGGQGTGASAEMKVFDVAISLDAPAPADITEWENYLSTRYGV